MKSIRLGESLLEVATGGGADDTDPAVDSGATAHIGAAAPAPWHAPLGAALLAGALSTDQHHAIRRGLGEPPHARTFLGDPLVDSDAGPLDDEAVARLEADRAEADLAVREAWSLAAEQLVLEAAVRTVEELAGSARAIRDRLDPEGAAERYAARFDQRSFRLYSNHDGTTMAHLVFDDEGAAWIREGATGSRRIARRITSTPGSTGAGPMSIAASCSADTTTCSFTTTDGASRAIISTTSCCIRRVQAR